MTDPVMQSTTMAGAVDSMVGELTAADPLLVGNDAFLAAVLSGCGDCIKVLDLQGRLQFMSEGGKRVMEVDDFAPLKGCPWPDFWSGDGNTAARQAVEAAIAGKPSRFVGEANTVKGNSRFWDVQVAPIFNVDGSPSHILSISKDISDVTDARQRLELLNGELQHRIKNTLAVVSAIARQTLKGDDIRDRRDAFTGRLQALAEANDMISTKALQDAPIRAVVENALRPHVQSEQRFSISGHDLDLTAKHALTVALTIHELATNATKYGALSDGNGKIDIRWQVDRKADNPNEAFHFVWQESGGPHVHEPKTQGFGSKLISRIFAADFAGQVSVEYHPTGLVCTMRAPIPQ
ncbi:Two-component sensor histidine kinase, contains HisKA and HATPase domains [Rhizobium sp. RU33A]|uniref:sensor histidine kinase n=1 Tax=Rhizobium sp. RU33A TaxID=1907413 RepID=UPI00095721A5|nr:HWE histidine kinase domain-containing protein [Rhizobium sp. RU33A]SIQ56339.1 Two-component sensor histidine kinase, contains HisKA and HATPase domains [Rhizobium sp. RU33A]